MKLENEMNKQEIRELQIKAAKFEALESAGVDNWDGFDDAIRGIRNQEELNDKIETCVDDILSAISEEIEQPAGSGCGYGVSNKGEDDVFDILRLFIRNIKDESLLDD